MFVNSKSKEAKTIPDMAVNLLQYLRSNSQIDFDSQDVERKKKCNRRLGAWPN